MFIMMNVSPSKLSGGGNEHLITNDTEGPNVNLVAVRMNFHFWGKVRDSSYCTGSGNAFLGDDSLAVV